ncbi:hypothetical protein Val02_85430 [Virgisporangium aliadipatigenens]|uniref:PE-PGRS family protein n=1 Tax=Virgisporangium aliadipatigenens TaxID=741659 RepID=A0A8J4DX23_9ACTN|nr:hypothetical protein [Virgisporangium aliadipatigenens]GIJ51657.1 hypothetical protein Val02_85430 [Virgisporangium aliadipatigenens]
MVDYAGALNARQVVVLSWIADGCPEGVVSGYSYKATAVALQGRRLVAISKRGGVWSATVTDAGRFYLAHGRMPERPTWKRAGRQDRRTVVASGSKPKRDSSAAPGGDRLGTPGDAAVVETAGSNPDADDDSSARTKAAAKGHRRGPVEQMLADLVDGGGVLLVDQPLYVAGRPSTPDFEQLVLSANRYGKVPAGKRLVTSHAAGRKLEIRLEDAIIGTDVVRRAVPVPQRVSRYHPVAVLFRDRSERHEISKPVVSRAVRLVHALVVEAERRGHEVGLAPDPVPYGGYSSGRRWSGTNDGHITVTIGGHAQAVRVIEVGMPSRRHWEQQNYLGRGSYSASNTGTGVLRFELTGYGGREGRTCRWADGKRTTLEDKLPDVLAEIETRAAEDAHRARQRQEAEAEAQRRLERAQRREAQKRLEKHRAEVLHDQVKRWERAARTRAYVAAMRTEIETRAAALDTGNGGGEVARAWEWLAWAEQHVDDIDPLTQPLALPAEVPGQ